VARCESTPRVAAPTRDFFSVLYHDAIYVAGRSDNEARSAEFACRELTAMAEVDLVEIKHLILLTAMHGKLSPIDISRDAALFLDCDMAILGSSRERFLAYEEAISREYAALPLHLFRAGRRRFIERLLHLPRIYLSEDFHARYDAQARANLNESLNRLVSAEAH